MTDSQSTPDPPKPEAASCDLPPAMTAAISSAVDAAEEITRFARRIGVTDEAKDQLYKLRRSLADISTAIAYPHNKPLYVESVQPDPDVLREADSGDAVPSPVTRLPGTRAPLDETLLKDIDSLAGQLTRLSINQNIDFEAIGNLIAAIRSHVGDQVTRMHAEGSEIEMEMNELTWGDLPEDN